MKTKPSCPPADFCMKDRRKLLQMPQETVAKMAGIKLRSYQRYERINALPLCMEKRLNLLMVLHD